MVHLQGDYWMERGTHGRLRSVGYNPKLFGTFESARDAFAATLTSGASAVPPAAAPPDAK
jgi:hypothetical protein